MTKKLPTAINRDEFDTLLKKTYKEVHKLAFLLAFASGLRISEIVGEKKLKTKCCDAYLDVKMVKNDRKNEKHYFCLKCQKDYGNNPAPHCNRSKLENDWHIEPLNKDRINIKERKIMVVGGKGAKDRVVPLSKGFKDKHLDLLPIDLSPRSLERAFKSAADRAGLLKAKPDLHFHNLRHSFASRCVESGMPIHHIRTLMGHSNISTTNIYLIANPKDALKSYEDNF